MTIIVYMRCNMLTIIFKLVINYRINETLATKFNFRDVRRSKLIFADFYLQIQYFFSSVVKDFDV